MKVTVKNNTLYFDEEATKLVVQHAKRAHKTFKQTVIAALKRGAKYAKKMEQQTVRKGKS